MDSFSGNHSANLDNVQQDLSLVETEPFLMTRVSLLRTMVYLYGTWPLSALAFIGFFALLAGIFIDIRWAIVFLLLLFIISPLLMVFLYFYHGLRPLTASNAILHTLSFSPEGITQRILKESGMDKKETEEWRERMEGGKDEIEKDKEGIKHNKDNQGKESAEEKEVEVDEEEQVDEEPEIRYERFCPADCVDKLRTSRDGFILTLKGTQAGFIWLPFTAFKKQSDYITAFRLIGKGCKTDTSN